MSKTRIISRKEAEQLLTMEGTKVFKFAVEAVTACINSIGRRYIHAAAQHDAPAKGE
mgnify:CR=1 FL=1